MWKFIEGKDDLGFRIYDFRDVAIKTGLEEWVYICYIDVAWLRAWQ